MKLLTLIIAGAAIAAGIIYITSEREDGTSILDELMENAPDWLEKGKQFATGTLERATGKINDVANS